jgi:hypothetical protein
MTDFSLFISGKTSISCSRPSNRVTQRSLITGNLSTRTSWHWKRVKISRWSFLLTAPLHSYTIYICITTCIMCDYRWGTDWWMDLLTTCTHHWELQAITAPQLISTVHKSPQQPLSLFQPAMSSPAVSLQRLLTVEILQLHALRFCLQSLPCRTLLSINWDRVGVTLRLAVYRQSVLLGDKPL